MSSSAATTRGRSSTASSPIGSARSPSERRPAPRRAAAGLAGACAVVLLLVAPARSGPAVPPAGTAAQPLKLAVVSFYNPRLMYLKYQPLVDYLSAHTPWHFELDLSGSYRETVDRLCEGRTQLAYLGPFSYLRAHQQCHVDPVVRLNSEGRATYTSYIMVREDSRIRTLADLRGKRFGFGAVLSTSGHVMPRFMLKQAGLEPGRDITCVYYAHHERAALAVLTGDVTACGVRDLVGDQLKGKGLRVLAQSAPMTNFPLVVGPRVPKGFGAAIVDALVALPRRDPRAAREIASWDVELAGGFAQVSPADYLPVAEFARRLFGPRALTAPAGDLTCSPGR